MTDPITRLNAALEGRYRVERDIGEGGMAVVYLAHDERHNRNVALKVLKPELAAVVGAERFLAEIRTTANLQHPHILPLFDSGQAESFLYYVMPFVEGETLRDRIDREKQLPLDDAVRLTSDIAEALDHAHRHGVVHRDINPGNILLSVEGQPTVADFGIALAVGGAGGDRLTRTGLSVGTPQYMSPEQATGDQHVGPPTDTYALGCVLYEMLAGEPPYSGGSAQAILARKIAEPVPGLRQVRDDVPVSVEDVVVKALAKEPIDRFETVAAFSSGLREANTAEARAAADRRLRGARRRQVGAAAAGVIGFGVAAWWLSTLLIGPAYEFLAVLPPTDLTDEPDQQYLLAGVHGGLITELQSAGIRVIAPSSVMQFVGDELPAHEIADSLGVDALIEASLSRVADSVELDLRLVDGATDEQLWFASYGGEVTDLPALYQEATRAIVDEIELALTPEVEARLAGARPVDPEAYEAYLRGQFHLGRRSSADLDTALQYFELALENDPNHALAYTGIAQVCNSRQAYGIVSPAEGRPRERTAAEKAIELDNTLAEAHHRLASIRTWDEWDWERGEAAYRRVIELNPNYAAARASDSRLLQLLGRPDEARVHIERALELDPFNDLFQGYYSEQLFVEGRYEEAIAQVQNALQTALNNVTFHSGLCDLFYATGRY